LDDLRPWHVIVATCAACGKQAHTAAALLHHRRPPYARLLDVERKLWCSGCGNRRGNTLTVSMAPKELNAFTGRLAQRRHAQPFRLALVKHVR
jgi:hypothetical protein